MRSLLGTSRTLTAGATAVAVCSTMSVAGLAAPTAAAPAAADPERRVPLSADGDGPVRQASVPLGPGRLVATSGGARTEPLPTARYSMVALTWRGPDPDAEVRVRQGGRWQGWEDVHELADGRPVSGRASDLMWVGPSDGVQVRTARRTPRALELVLIDPGRLPSDDAAATTAARTSTTGTATRTSTAGAGERAPVPNILGRKQWGADPDWRNGKPVYLDRLKQVHLHHTVTTNDYSRSDVPGLIRGMYRYHTQTLGWFDIGYNFLVDRFGRGWVGRSGGYARRVQGAHTLGFNHSSTGIAYIGTNRAPDPAVTKIVRLAAWKLDKEGRKAQGKVLVTSRGSDRYPAGRKVWLPAVDGHRDTNDTACPGNRLYRHLPEIRTRAQGRINRF